jgi:tRNA dimethylallyltransferase
MTANPPLLVVVGPTASGKTGLAVSLAQALNGEVVSADSVQIYRYFDIGSGKPSEGERGGVPHHLLDVLDPLQEVDAARYAELADAAIAEVRSRGKLPIVCGGTFLWVRALLYGLAPVPAKDEALREQHRALAEREGRAALHALLREVDPESHQRLSPNDFVRVSRALEVHALTGKPLSVVQAEHGFRSLRHRALLLGIRYSPEALSERISARCQLMLQQGWVEEVRSLLARGYADARAMAAVGYREVHAALQTDSAIDEGALHAAVVQKTRVFARRQRTWLRDRPVNWLQPGQTQQAAVARVRELLAASELTSD